jgi:tetratricopeptide (TPR) repeat protein
MRRFSERAHIASFFAWPLGVVLVSCVVLGSLGGCEQLDGRRRVRVGNRLFRETQFVEAAAQYEMALHETPSPTIDYNLGLAYSKVFKPGFDGPVLLGQQGDVVCQSIPNAKIVQTGACVKEGDRHYAECGAAKAGPIEKAIAELNDHFKNETDEAKKKEIKSQLDDKQQDLMRYTCSSSFRCVEGAFCSLTSPELADLAAQHFQTWIKSQPNDEELKKQLAEASEDLERAKKADNKSATSSAQRRVDELQTKDQTRKQMTLLWTDSDQYRKALEYWESLLKDKPNDGEIMGVLAGINLKAGDWRKSIEWYNKVADVTNDASSKVAAYQFIGNVAWSKLNSRTLIGAEAVELADRGIGALQRAAELQPKNPRPVGLEASIFNFRSTSHGASWAAAIDRASAQDLLKLSRVLADEAKKAQGQAPGAPTTPPATPPASGSSAPPQAGSGTPTPPPSQGGSSGAPPAAHTGSGAAASPTASASPRPAAPAAPAPPPVAPAAPAPEAPAAAAPAAVAPTGTGSAPAAAPETPPAAPASGGSAEKSGG